MKTIRLSPSLTLALVQAREATKTYFRPALNEMGLTEQQWRVICTLYQYDELENNHLAELTCILRPSLTGIVNRMAEQNLIIKSKDLHDQRVSLIKLTQAGRNYFESQALKMEESYKNIKEQYGAEKIQQLMELLHDLSKIKSN
ncbi:MULTISPECIES: homoprotocatechuate degradation operon regulator HpaR [Acinetobacter]|jgi:homoprotocatechuate degradation regulator HpaR|uniref:Homoprotocatechuate degradation operon regulator HpaR n=5 Tax=Acinetobacter bereziniae TaxID=106648 RepID=A0A0A8TLC5_ACIBZ|nr:MULTISPECIES: homoprotocatechuate degradation operon regulator HpaR [Acinetobacter]MEC8122592.1 homoprotocatechuate degradation operon regulator HpaR [Pseudomonadota bacterium]ATZ63980.1 homoprotocatechuate degradation operon regulator, HpaR [Acinetobacter bereziniae]ELW77677.1 homoprotocatechuate degradation operon regulator, HpaR [Acinetobacter sp. WC-743]ENV21927.1 homoprotocatechuate degradation operon regulator, HpaR [Acinetobacter bereziniae NIPH 3]ENV95596.1 homoprotocatechuate degra